MILTSERLYLRPLQMTDAAIILASTMDEEIRYMTGTRQQFTLNQIESFILAISEDDSRLDMAICLSSTDEMIGELSLLDIDTNDNHAGFRISLSRVSLTSMGFGTEAMKLILHFAFIELQLNRIQLEVFSHNTRGIRAYKKLGFLQEGILRQTMRYDGVYADEIIMAMLKEDYLKLYA